MGTEQVKRLKELEKENAWLKRVVAECVKRIEKAAGASERSICVAVGQNRPTQRYTSSVGVYSILPRQAVINYASKNGHYGYRDITGLLRMDGWGIKYKRVERIWKQEGLKAPLFTTTKYTMVNRPPEPYTLRLTLGFGLADGNIRREHVQFDWGNNFYQTQLTLENYLRLTPNSDELPRT